jgi:hypothetical protein
MVHVTNSKADNYQPLPRIQMLVLRRALLSERLCCLHVLEEIAGTVLQVADHDLFLSQYFQLITHQ